MGRLYFGSEGKQSVEWPFAQTRGTTTQRLLGPSLMTGQGQEKYPTPACSPDPALGLFSTLFEVGALRGG